MYAPDLNLIAGVVIIVLLVCVVLVLLKTARDNQNLIIAFCDELGENTRILMGSLSSHVKELRNENKALSNKIIDAFGNFAPASLPEPASLDIEHVNQRLLDIISFHENYRKQVNVQAKTLTAILGELQKVNTSLAELHTFHDIMTTKLNDSNPVTSQDALELTRTQQENMKAINKSLANITKITAELESVLNTASGNLESAAVKADNQLRRLIKNAISKLTKEYGDNLDEIFRLIDSNLTAVIMDIKKKAAANKNESQT